MTKNGHTPSASVAQLDGCTDDAGRAGGLCLPHASEQARALDTAARRELVANA